MPENFTQVAGKKTEVLEHLTISDGFLLFCHNTYRWRAGCVPTQATFKCGLTFSCAMRLRWLYLTTSLGFRRPCGASSWCYQMLTRVHHMYLLKQNSRKTETSRTIPHCRPFGQFQAWTCLWFERIGDCFSSHRQGESTLGRWKIRLSEFIVSINVRRRIRWHTSDVCLLFP